MKIILLRKTDECRREYVFFFVKEKTVYYADIISNVFQAVKKGDMIFMGKYLFTGSETTSVWLEVR